MTSMPVDMSLFPSPVIPPSKWDKGCTTAGTGQQPFPSLHRARGPGGSGGSGKGQGNSGSGFAASCNHYDDDNNDTSTVLTRIIFMSLNTYENMGFSTCANSLFRVGHLEICQVVKGGLGQRQARQVTERNDHHASTAPTTASLHLYSGCSSSASLCVVRRWDVTITIPSRTTTKGTEKSKWKG